MKWVNAMVDTAIYLTVGAVFARAALSRWLSKKTKDDE